MVYLGWGPEFFEEDDKEGDGENGVKNGKGELVEKIVRGKVKRKLRGLVGVRRGVWERKIAGFSAVGEAAEVEV